jgi:dTDP-glucose 4,6-dehydratase
MKSIYVDIDDTICKTNDTDYANAVPKQIAIDKVNDLYDKGHYITMWTARGTITGIDWYNLTFQQLKKWGVKFHQLKMGKPAFDLFIDDKVLNSLMHWTDRNIDLIFEKKFH